jgi:hypothetical protein
MRSSTKPRIPQAPAGPAHNLPEFLLTGLRTGGAERQRLSNGRPPRPHETGRSARAPNALSPTIETGNRPWAYALSHENCQEKASGLIPAPRSNQPPVTARGFSGLAPRARRSSQPLRRRDLKRQESQPLVASCLLGGVKASCPPGPDLVNQRCHARRLTTVDAALPHRRLWSNALRPRTRPWPGPGIERSWRLPGPRLAPGNTEPTDGTQARVRLQQQAAAIREQRRTGCREALSSGSPGNRPAASRPARRPGRE